MPRAFSEAEKGRIRSLLIEKGEELFARYGLKKTSVEDLTRAAGISKGAFYSFYASKEELYFDIVENFETGFRQELLERVLQPGVPLRERFKGVLVDGFGLMQTHPLFSGLRSGDLEALYRALPPERVQAHIRRDEDFAAELMAAMQSVEPAFQNVDPKVAAGLIRALFFISSHQDELGEDVYVPTFDTLLDLVLDHLLGPLPAQ